MTPPFHILAVDDDEQDLSLLRRALAADAHGVRLETVGDGAEALAYLRGKGAYAARPRPALVLLDLNMPRMDGRSFLAALRADPVLRVVPVVMLTSSSSGHDAADCYALGANCFVTKQAGFEDYRAALRAVVGFWSTVAVLPQPPEQAAPVR